MPAATRWTVVFHCVLVLALGACSGQVTGGEMSGVGAPSPAGGAGVTSAASPDSQRMSAATGARGRARPTLGPEQQARQEGDRASDVTGGTRADDRQRTDDEADGGASDSHERDGGIEDDGGAPDGEAVPCSAHDACYGDRACERRCCGRGRATREHASGNPAATRDQAD